MAALLGSALLFPFLLSLKLDAWLSQSLEGPSGDESDGSGESMDSRSVGGPPWVVIFLPLWVLESAWLAAQVQPPPLTAPPQANHNNN